MPRDLQIGNRVGASNRHMVGYLSGANKQSSFQETGKADGIIDLIWKIASTCGNNVSALFLGCIRPDLRHRIGTGKDNGFWSH